MRSVRRAPSLTRKRILAFTVLALVLLPLALRGRRPSVQVPASAAAGSTIELSATGLRPGAYAALLVARHPPPGALSCAATIASEHSAGTAFAASARIPLQLRCVGPSGAATGSTAVGPGAYALVVGVRSHGGFSGRYSLVRRILRIT
jgi:hypothetical protein